MKSLILLFAVVASSALLAEADLVDVHDPAYRKTTSFIEKGDHLESPQHGSGLHKHSEANPHHDDSHSHEDSAEHKRHVRAANEEEEVGTRRLGSGSYSHDRRPGSSSLGSGSYHHGSGLGSGSYHHGSSGLGGSHGTGFGHHGSGSLHSGSHRPGSSGLGSGSLHLGGSGHHRRGTANTNDGISGPRTGLSEESGTGKEIGLSDGENSCLLSNVAPDNFEDRALQCNGVECTFTEKSDRHSSYSCGDLICDILNTVGSAQQPERAFECRGNRSLIKAPLRCPQGTRPDRTGRCRPEY